MLKSPPAGWPLDPYPSALGVPAELLSADARKKLGQWLDLLVTWNARIDLTAARGTGELLDLMIADALVLAHHIPQGESVVDVGTGAGAPGLALAILRPDLRVTLVEPLTKRVSFLRTVQGTIDRIDIKLVRAKAEDIIATGAKFDVAMARATLPPDEWLPCGLALTAPGGSVFTLLAKEAPPTDARAESRQDVSYVWPNMGVARRLVRYVNVGE